MSLQSVNPANGKEIATYDELTPKEVEDILESVDAAFNEWKHTSFSSRSELLRKAGNNLRENKDEYGKLMSLEMGKPYNQAVAEAEKCGWVCDFYADESRKNTFRYIDRNRCLPKLCFPSAPWNSLGGHALDFRSG